MSLKVFHIFFILLAVFCSLGFSAWTMQFDDVGILVKVAGAGSGVIGLLLAGYGYWFVTKKSKRIIT
jgi:hypothetical protein